VHIYELMEKVDQLGERANSLFVKGLPRLALPLPVGLWAVLVQEDRTWESLLLVFGPFFAVAGLVVYYRSLWGQPAPGSTSVIAALRVFAGIVPLAFLALLAFYYGLWGLVRLAWDFSIAGTAQALFLGWLGFSGIGPLHLLTQLRHPLRDAMWAVVVQSVEDSRSATAREF
jgi:hypothetical protein